MGKKSSPAPVTDPNISANAATQAKISQEQWDWFQNQYLPQQMQTQQTVQNTSQNFLSDYLNNIQPAQAAAYQGAAQAGTATQQAALDQMQQQAQTGTAMMGMFGNQYLPIYGQIAQEAAAKGGQADQDYQAMLARGDVSQAYANQAAQTQRYLAQYGQSPVSGAATAGVRGAAISQAAQEAAAQTAARQAASNLGWTYRQQAAQIGQGLLNSGNQTFQQSQQSGLNALNAETGVMNAGNTYGAGQQQALGIATTPIQSYNTIASGMTQGMQGVNQGYGSANQALNTQLQTNAQQQQQAQSSKGSMFGSILGAVGTIGGAMLGGPVGASIGGALGSAIGGMGGGGGGGGAIAGPSQGSTDYGGTPVDMSSPQPTAMLS